MILQRVLPYSPDPAVRLPGIAPLNPATWLIRDEAFEAQLALKAELLATRRGDVLAEVPGSEAAQAECLDEVQRHLREDHGILAKPKSEHPLIALSEIAQEDFVIMEKRGAEHVLTAALLTFPASWRLAEKIGRPLTAIHEPVGEYTADVARRVQRLFDGVQVGRPLWRYNQLWYQDPALFQPRSASDPRPKPDRTARYFRTERQCVVRLPETRAVVFSIHTWVLARASIEGAAQSRT